MARTKRVIEAERKAEKAGMAEKRQAMKKLLAMEDQLNEKQKLRLVDLKKKLEKRTT